MLISERGRCTVNISLLRVIIIVVIKTLLAEEAGAACVAFWFYIFDLGTPLWGLVTYDICAMCVGSFFMFNNQKSTSIMSVIVSPSPRPRFRYRLIFYPGPGPGWSSQFLGVPRKKKSTDVCDLHFGSMRFLKLKCSPKTWHYTLKIRIPCRYWCVRMVSNIPMVMTNLACLLEWNQSEFIDHSVDYFEDECVHKLE